MAHLSKDPGLLSAFQEGEDVHSKTASEVFNVGIEDVSSDLRRNAKAQISVLFMVFLLLV